MNTWLTSILTSLFDFFKTKSPKVYAVFIGVIALVWVADGQGFINLPQVVVDLLLALGLVAGTSTPKVNKS